MKTLRNLKKTLIFGLLAILSFSNLKCGITIIDFQHFISGDFDLNLSEKNRIQVSGQPGHLIIESCFVTLNDHYPLTCFDGAKVVFKDCILVVNSPAQIPFPLDTMSEIKFLNCRIIIDESSQNPITHDRVFLDNNTIIYKGQDNVVVPFIFLDRKFQASNPISPTLVSSYLDRFGRQMRQEISEREKKAYTLALEDFPDSDSDDSLSVSITPTSPQSNLDGFEFPESPMKK